MQLELVLNDTSEFPYETKTIVNFERSILDGIQLLNIEVAEPDNKIYLLRSLRCRSSSRARPYAPEDRGQSTSGTLVLCFAARRSGHIW
jgi:hypothetical protein